MSSNPKQLTNKEQMAHKAAAIRNQKIYVYKLKLKQAEQTDISKTMEFNPIMKAIGEIKGVRFFEYKNIPGYCKEIRNDFKPEYLAIFEKHAPL